MPGERSIGWAASVQGRKSSNHAGLRSRQGSIHLQIPSQAPPRMEQERMYPRPLTRRETGEPKAKDQAQMRAQAYTDRAPTFTGSETIDTTGKTTASAVSSSSASTKLGSGVGSSGAKGLCRSRDNNRKRPNPRSSRDPARKEGIPGPARENTNSEIGQQVRKAYAREGNTSKFTEVFSP
jgi:hypothetical protein